MTARIWTMPDIADELGVPPDTVRSWRRRGHLPEPTGRAQRSPWWQGEPIETWLRERAGRMREAVTRSAE